MNLSTKFQLAKVGDLIRVLTHPGNHRYYRIGMVTEVNGDTLSVRGIATVSDGVSQRLVGEFTAPQNGAHHMDAIAYGRIVVL